MAELADGCPEDAGARSFHELGMSNWFHGLPVAGLAFLVFAATALVTAAIYAVVIGLARGERARWFKGVSPGMLPPLALVFGLLVAFLAAQVWGNADRARTTVNHEASALRAVVLLAASFPGEPERQLRALVHRQIHDAVTHEWPAMAGRQATLAVVPTPLSEALQIVLGLSPKDDGQRIAQRELVSALESSLDARRQRIIISQTRISWVKWMGVIVEAALTLIAIACVHSDNRGAAIITLALFAAAVAVSIVLIASHDRPFTGPHAVPPALLLQISPAER